MDNLIVYYKLDSSKPTYDPSTKVTIIRDSNETSITLKQSDKLIFTDVNSY
jgi:hypothetical protein